ncbi:DUF397 domain-containing protein [Streptomyces sp. MAR4 CNX-425]|uniref:DUF397 domain-containing protein n=1 Tax=Streptomyces sp. MAR4 CNX-425 TaxID=3406343 RepID=UPI003B50B474
MQYDLSEAVWRKSTHSSGNGQCIEVADGYPGVIPVRDSKAPEGPFLVFGADAWTSFVQAVKHGDFSA